MPARGTQACRAEPYAPSIDRLFALYLVLSGAALAFPHRPGGWYWLALLHVVGAALLLKLPPFDRVRATAAATAPRAARILHDWYALLLMPALYMLQVFDRVFASGSGETLVMLSALALLALVLGYFMDAVRARVLACAGRALDRRLSPTVLAVRAPFEPEGGAYGGHSHAHRHHHHSHDP